MSEYIDSDSERAVLGCVLLNNEVIENAIEILTPNDFFESKHQRIFATMQTMYENNEPIECLSLSKSCRKGVLIFFLLCIKKILVNLSKFFGLSKLKKFSFGFNNKRELSIFGFGKKQ